MPKGSGYPGPGDRLERYRAIVERHPDAEVKGAKNPDTSVNGWMTSFLDPAGAVCLRLDPDSIVAVPAELADDDELADRWFAASWDFTAAKPPKT